MKMYGMMAAVMLLATGIVTAALPYAVLPAGRAQAFPLTTAENESLGTAALGWTEQHLVVEARVRDATPVSLADAGVGIDEAYLADSVEFWIGRHQFVMAAPPAGGRLWDYLYQRPVAGAETTFEKTADGYRLRTAVPWEVLGLSPKDGVCFPFALQVNDRQRVKDGVKWKESARQPLFPLGAAWDRVSTYATVFLASVPVADAAPAPTAFAALARGVGPKLKR